MQYTQKLHTTKDTQVAHTPLRQSSFQILSRPCRAGREFSRSELQDHLSHSGLAWDSTAKHYLLAYWLLGSWLAPVWCALVAMQWHWQRLTAIPLELYPTHVFPRPFSYFSNSLFPRPVYNLEVG